MGQRLTITESERNRIKGLYENKIDTNEQSVASDLYNTYKNSIFNPANLGKKVANYFNKEAQSAQAERDFQDPRNIKNAVANFILVLTKELGYKHFSGSQTGEATGDVILTKKIKYGHVMLFVNMQNGEIDGTYHSVDLGKGYGNNQLDRIKDNSDFEQHHKVGNVKNWNKAMILNFEKNLESHALLQGKPDQTGAGSLAEGKKKVIRLTESEIKQYVNKLMSKQK
jgi:hypothetical protein